jgi:hypothetical protein
MSLLTSAATRIRGRRGRGHALVQRKAPSDEPLPEGQGQAQQGEEAKNQVQDHGSLLMVVFRAIVIEPATGRLCKSEIRSPKTEGNPKAEIRTPRVRTDQELIRGIGRAVLR